MSANPNGQRMPRAERHAQVVAMKERGMTFKQIAAELGLSRSAVTDAYYDPAGEKARARKAARNGTCRDCGAPTKNSGAVIPPERCRACAGAHQRAMTRAWIIESFHEWERLFGVPPNVTDWSPAHARAAGQLRKVARHESTDRPWPAVSAVQDIFGSWNAGRAAAGYDTYGPGQYGRDGELPDVIADTARRYLAGMSCREIATEDDVSTNTVEYRLEKAGVPRRTISEAHRLRRERERAAA